MNNWSKLHGNARIFLSLHSSFPEQTSGYAVRSHAIATHLLEHGVDLAVYTRPGFPWCTFKTAALNFEDEVDGIRYNRLPLLSSGVFEHLYGFDTVTTQMIEAMHSENARLVHTASNYETGFPAVMAAQSLGLPSIYEYRGMWHYTRLAHVPWFIESEGFHSYHNIEIQTGKSADAVFAISEALKRDLVANGIDENKVTVIPNAADTKHFAPLEPDTALKAQLGITGKKVVGFIGSITAYEGLEYIMDAVLELNMLGENVIFLVVGSGGYDQHLARHHALRGNHPAIIFTGRVPFSEVDRYYSIVDIMAFPRINAKVCQCVPPLKPLEAMVMRKPIIVSDVAALTEIVQHEKTGLVCEADNVASLTAQLGRLLGSPELCKELVDNAESWVYQERTWNKVSRLILNVYEKLL